MGLDMYLSAEKYVSASDYRAGDKEKFDAIVKSLEAEKFVGGFVPNVQVQVSVGYWRKVNSVHQWFVDNCGKGEDDCRPYYVPRDKLIELRDLCQQVLASPDQASELLPTQSGFFFGDTEYGEYYFADIRDTVEQLDKVLTEVPEDWDFEYRASW